MKNKLIWIVLFVIFFAIYIVTSSGNTPFDYFTRLAGAFLKGQYWLTIKPSWLTELIPVAINRFYVVYPPMPAILLMPFVFVFGITFPQQLLAHALGAGVVILTMKISLAIKKDRTLAIWSGLLVGVGTIVWYMSASGSVWNLGQICSLFFLTFAVLESLTNKSAFKIGIFLGAAYLSRTHVIVSLPFFVYLLSKNGDFKKQIINLVLGLLPFVVFDIFYNLIRFSTPWNNGYFLLPTLLDETKSSWFINGVASPLYIPNGLKTAFWSFPIFLKKVPFIQPSWNGLSIWITTPAFIYALRAKLKDGSVIFSWLAIIFIFLIVLSHGGNGFAQFGYRFAVDFYPFLMFLTIKGVAKTGLTWHHWLLLTLAIIVNLWGVVWINKFGWVSY